MAAAVVVATVVVVELTAGDEVVTPPARPPVTPIAVDARLGEVVHRSPQANATEPGTDRHWVSGQHCRPAEHPDTGRALGKYTAWSGAWLGDDGTTIAHSFMQVTGPTAPYPKRCDGDSVAGPVSQAESFARATSTQIIRSTRDGGRRWRTVHAGAVIGTHPIPFTPQATIALRAHPDSGVRQGTLLRRGNGADLQDVAAYRGRPSTAFLQRLAPGATRWVDVPTPYGQGVVLDPDRFSYQFSRLRRLADGRLIAVGSVGPAGSTDFARYRWLLMVSGDEGTTWSSALTVPPGAPPPNEWDVAEIPDGSGDLLAVMRTQQDGEQIRAQARLVKGAEDTTTTTGTPNSSAGWIMEQLRKAPAQLPHSGHPELLSARVGRDDEPAVIIDFATTGVHYTTDAGATWRPLPFPSGELVRTGYYPRSVQAADGTIFVFAHRGADDPYRPDLDQAIVMDRFALRAAPRPRARQPAP
ncbi:MAG: sialidase family protein [Solirubrobacteraceae bacterium]|nr:sialidase family protein [Solirubrobacteraceae bacterium]